MAQIRILFAQEGAYGMTGRFARRGAQCKNPQSAVRGWVVA